MIGAAVGRVSSESDDSQLLAGQMLVNLLENAVRHTPPGNAIALRAGASAQAVWVEVADRGQGLAPNDLPYVFDKCYRGRLSGE